MMKKVFLAVLMLTFAGKGVVAKNLSFNEADKAAIGKIVEEYILDNPEIIVKAITKLQEAEEKASQERRKDSIVSQKDNLNDNKYPYFGDNNAKTVIYHFYDYNCSYCKIMSKTVIELAEKDKDLKIVMKDTPIFGDESEYTAKAGLFANTKGKFKEFYTEMMNHKGKSNEESAKSIIKKIGLKTKEMEAYVKSNEAKDMLAKTKDIALDIGIQSMPTTIIGTELFLGAASYDKMEELIKNHKEDFAGKAKKEIKKDTKEEK